VIPVGPLHPTDAIYALGFGVAVGAMAFRSMKRWSVLVVLAALAVMSGRHPGDISNGFVDRPLPWLVAAFAAAFAAGSWWVTSRRRAPVHSTALGVLAACVAVWAVVPDTESPLIAGSVILGAMVFMPRGGAADGPGVAWVLPIGAGVIGSVGMPNRLFVAALATVLVVAAVSVAQFVLGRRRESTTRAGDPTTVVNGATSSTTTAPAPITAP